ADEDQASFADAISVMTAQMLQMPAFLYLVEAPAEPGMDRALSGLELPRPLPFHWGTPPPTAGRLAPPGAGLWAPKPKGPRQARPGQCGGRPPSWSRWEAPRGRGSAAACPVL